MAYPELHGITSHTEPIIVIIHQVYLVHSGGTKEGSVECLSDILVTYAKILSSRHVLIDKMVLEFLCCVGFSCKNNGR
jgi:hypothetical protein